MKKNILILIVVIVLAVTSGRLLYYKVVDVFALNKDNRVYLLQLGVYSNMDTLKSDTSSINSKIIVKNNNNYYVYVGISREKDNLKKISNMYNKLGYNLYLQEEYIDDEGFINNLNQFDILLKSAKTEDEINSITSVMLSNYQEKFIKSY